MARPKSFDSEEKLSVAMNLFWRQGFKATSLDDLESHLQLKRYSIYNAFGEKRQLYRQAVELYIRTMFEPAIKPLLESDDLDAIETFFADTMAYFADQPDRLSCFVFEASREVSPEFEDVAALTARANTQLKQSFVSVLQRAVDKGQAQSSLGVWQAADFLVTFYRGVVGSNCVEPDAQWMASVLSQLRQILHSWRAS
ncbi:TetR/AcrR family transcriptional regulator [Neiella sp. HB171785]|uniref:TetR/AcrR family transcriptional regulator n=1 Tax=Neiella litorisoli TaxID=2771431 RepID=A0A8J6ULG5_9GAMM|nr:TetR/AcrR family transcriptional regulator [Neiella litorisoli]MBD1388935.1 TetR/AcrR family transcriptional regulator [Neiella litorisoli]